jgi:hypothetical protein
MNERIQSKEIEKLLSLKEGAEVLGIGLTSMKTRTDIPYVRIGRRKLFRPEDLRAFIEKNVRGKNK